LAQVHALRCEMEARPERPVGVLTGDHDRAASISAARS